MKRIFSQLSLRFLSFSLSLLHCLSPFLYNLCYSFYFSFWSCFSKEIFSIQNFFIINLSQDLHVKKKKKNNIPLSFFGNKTCNIALTQSKKPVGNSLAMYQQRTTSKPRSRVVHGLGLCPTQTWPQWIQVGKSLTHNWPGSSFGSVGSGRISFGSISVGFGFAGVEQNLAGFWLKYC